MKKTLSLLLAGTMCFSLATGVFAESAIEAPALDGGGATLTLALRSGTYADVIKECLPEFEKAYNVKTEVLELAEDDLHSKLALDATNKSGAYDLCMVDGSWMAEFTANGVLANLTELGYELDDDIIPATTDICYYEDNLYLAPYYGNVTVLLYNKELAKAAGYDGSNIDSLEDILKICQAAKDAGKNGFIYRGDTENNLVVDAMPILLSYGAWVVDEDNNPTVNTPEFKEAMNFYMDLIATGDAEVKDDLIASVDNGAGAMGIGWPGWYVPTADSAADYCAISGKAAADSEAFNANVYGVWTIGVTANSENKELTAALLEYLMDPEVQKSTVADGGVPCRYSSLQDEEILAQFPQYKVVCEALESGVYRPVIEEWTDFYTILGTELGNIVNGVKTVDEGLDDAQSQLEATLGM
ncbi:MAG: extracellular solute-binding protein [Lachnospiraceae bacterium]|nr:extracellular solute-binding protein [Lachnospiraceae bacterium]